MQKKTIALITGLLFLLGSVPAHAAIGDWVMTKYDEFTQIQFEMPTRATSSVAFASGRAGDTNGVWVHPDQVTLITEFDDSRGFPALQLRVDPNGISEFGQIFGLIDGIDLQLAGKLSTTTLASALSPISATIDQMNANLFGTSTTMRLSTASTTAGLLAKTEYNSLMDMVAASSTFVNVQADWNQTATSSGAYIQNKPTIYNAKAYEGTTLRNGAFSVFKNATVSSGVATFHLTADGTSGGTALCTNGIIQDSIDVEVNDATASYQMSYALSNANKTVTVTANKLTTANILTGILGQTQANGSVVRLVATCY